ncbi:hypothetical protein ABD87_14895 [Lysinibacillus sphaericus]|uniref:DUF5348 domain-containing protein n=1 Tax=Lysinibacillus sphaericus TaxID=1421 RepID=UPI0018CDE521|nr:hypothetical protein [Lysinibacillus sphaericus]
MNLNVNEAQQKLEKLNGEIYSVLKSLGRYCDNVIYDSNDIDEKFLRDQFYFLSNKLEDVHGKIDYFSKSIVGQGFLKLNDSKRYALPSGDYLNSGSVCELLYTDNENEQYWVYTSIEHSGNDYYATALGKDHSINGMMARIRG